jgi:1-acyl-sn-glycerol-3-phosphate acyltransferase
MPTLKTAPPVAPFVPRPPAKPKPEANPKLIARYEAGVQQADPAYAQKIRDLDTQKLSRWADVHVDGLENIPKEGGALLVLNHRAMMDPLYTAAVVSRSGRDVVFMAKGELWTGQPFKALGGPGIMDSGGHIPVARGTAQSELCTDQAVKSLLAGNLVAIYPGGTFGKNATGIPDHPKTGEPNSIQPGAADIALRADVPVIPIVHSGTEKVVGSLVTGKVLFGKKPTVDFVIGEALQFEADPVTPFAPHSATVKAATAVIRDTLVEKALAQNAKLEAAKK